MHGDGVYSYNETEYYKGRFEENMKNGPGLMVNNNYSIRGVWINDQKYDFGPFYLC